MPKKADLVKSTIISGGRGIIEEHAMFTIRSFRADDQPAVRRLILRGLGEHFGYIDTSLNPDVDNIWASYIQNGHIFVVADIAGEVGGTGALLIQPHQTGQLVRISVANHLRRQGLGTVLVQHLSQIGREHGIERFVIETNRNWHEVISLYQRCGFSEYKQDDESIYMQCLQPNHTNLN